MRDFELKVVAAFLDAPKGGRLSGTANTALCGSTSSTGHDRAALRRNPGVLDALENYGKCHASARGRIIHRVPMGSGTQEFGLWNGSEVF